MSDLEFLVSITTAPVMTFIVLIALKLTSTIQTSWLWVTSPIWIFILYYATVTILFEVFEVFKERRKKE